MEEKRIRYVDGDQVTAVRPEGGSSLRVEIKDDQVILAARVKRVFPLSATEQYYSLQTAGDKEVAIIRSLDTCDKATRNLIEDELDRRYFSPIIGRIKDVKSVPGMWSFDVVTNRGDIEFYVRNWRDSSVEIERGRWHITSVDGLRFEIPDIDKLDRHSQTLLEQLL